MQGPLVIPFVLSFIRCAKESRVGNVSAAFCQSLAEIGYSHKAASIDMYQKDDQPSLSRAINEFGLNLHRMALLPKAFWRVFLPKLAKLVDCEDQILHAQTADYMRSLDILRVQIADLQQQIHALKTDKAIA